MCPARSRELDLVLAGLRQLARVRRAHDPRSRLFQAIENEGRHPGWVGKDALLLHLVQTRAEFGWCAQAYLTTKMRDQLGRDLLCIHEQIDGRVRMENCER